MPIANRYRQSGFTLLEAVIALTILASGATAIYAWVNSSLLTLNRVYAINEAADTTRNLLEELAASDPGQEPELRLSYGDTSFHVQREVSGYMAPAIGDDGRYSINDALLYRTAVIATKNGEQVRFELWELGLNQTRTIDEVLF